MSSDETEVESESGQEEEYKSLEECDSYEEFVTEVMFEDPRITGREFTGWKWLVVKILVYLLIGSVLLVSGGLVLYALYEVFMYMLDYIARELTRDVSVTNSIVFVMFILRD